MENSNGSLYLHLDFQLKDINVYGYVGEGVVKVALLDLFDLTFFDWYHYIDLGASIEDAKGAMNDIEFLQTITPFSKEQLLDIDFSQYEYLSDVQVAGVPIFQTNHRLQFKISEGDMFDISSHNYYVPSLNTKHPMTISQAFDYLNNTISSEKNELHIYDSDEVFQLDVKDADILSALSQFDVEHEDAVDNFRVFEDYFGSSDGALNNEKYPVEDPQFYQYVHFIGDDICADTNIEIAQSAIVDIRIDGNDAFTKELNKLGLSALHGEHSPAYGIQLNTIDLSILDEYQKHEIVEHIKKFMKLHICYSKESDGIALYVNYQNYINSPYTKLSDSKMYMKQLPATYAKIMPGASEIVTICIQFRQFINGIVIGMQDIQVATYKIYNLSDDKPKLIISKLNEL